MNVIVKLVQLHCPPRSKSKIPTITVTYLNGLICNKALRLNIDNYVCDMVMLTWMLTCVSGTFFVFFRRNDYKCVILDNKQNPTTVNTAAIGKPMVTQTFVHDGYVWSLITLCNFSKRLSICFLRVAYRHCYCCWYCCVIGVYYYCMMYTWWQTRSYECV